MPLVLQYVSYFCKLPSPHHKSIQIKDRSESISFWEVSKITKSLWKILQIGERAFIPIMKWNLLKFRRLNMQKFTSSNRQKYRTNQKYVEKSWSLPKFWRSKRQKYCSNRWNEAKNKISRRKVTNQTNLQCLPAFGKLTSTITLTNLKNAYLLLVSLPPRRRLPTSKTLTCLPNAYLPTTYPVATNAYLLTCLPHALWPQTIVMPKI